MVTVKLFYMQPANSVILPKVHCVGQMYVHRSGRTARADTDGISIALISPSDRTKYTTLCRALNKVGISRANFGHTMKYFCGIFLSLCGMFCRPWEPTLEAFDYFLP